MKCYIALIFCTLGFSGVAAAQETRAVVTETAAIYLTPDATRTPLRTAAVDTQLRVRGEEGNWLRVEFQDPQFGQRTGYVQANMCG